MHQGEMLEQTLVVRQQLLHIAAGFVLNKLVKYVTLMQVSQLHLQGQHLQLLCSQLDILWTAMALKALRAFIRWR
jgi:hypothetical protein